jgi:hypothetical protein
MLLSETNAIEKFHVLLESKHDIRNFFVKKLFFSLIKNIVHYLVLALSNLIAFQCQKKCF